MVRPEGIVCSAGRDLFGVLSLYGKIYCAEQRSNEVAIPSRKGKQYGAPLPHITQ